MSFYVPLRCGSLLIPTNASKHVFIILNDPNEDPEGLKRVVIVPICTVRQEKRYDTTMIITKADGMHPMIKRDSFIDYQFAKAESSVKLIAGVDSGAIQPKATIDEGWVIRIIDGLFDSPKTPSNIVGMLQNTR